MSRAAIATRAEQIRELAARRMTTRQIGDCIGLGKDRVIVIARKYSIKILTDQQLYAEKFPTLQKRPVLGKKSDGPRCPDFSHEELARKISYDPITGDFRWLDCGRIQSRVGQIAGAKCRGGEGGTYRIIIMFSTRILAHRLAWFYVHGKWPSGIIDHRDGNGLNNAISNLRECTHTQNCQNRESKGFSLLKRTGKFIAQITVNKKHIHLGTHDTADLARAAYVAARARYFGEFAVQNSGAAA